VPLRIRVQIAERQCRAIGLPYLNRPRNLAAALKTLLRHLAGDLSTSPKMELHHRPALCNRLQVMGKYHPDANDPNFLIYLPADQHIIETRVRGLAGQYSDLALRRKQKRINKKRGQARRDRVKKWPRTKLRGRPFDKTRTRKFSGQVVPRKR
jgi:hypothetical protein